MKNEGLSKEEYDALRDQTLVSKLSDSDLRREMERKNNTPARISILEVEARARNAQRMEKRNFWRWS